MQFKPAVKKAVIILAILLCGYFLLFLYLDRKAERYFRQSDYERVITVYRSFPIFPLRRERYDLALFYADKDTDKIRVEKIVLLNRLKEELLAVPSKKGVHRFILEHQDRLDTETVFQLSNYYVLNFRKLNAFQSSLMRLFLIKTLATGQFPDLLQELNDPRNSIKQDIYFHALNPEETRSHVSEIIRYTIDNQDYRLLSKIIRFLDEKTLDTLWNLHDTRWHTAILESADTLPQHLEKKYILSGLQASNPHILYKAVQQSRLQKDDRIRALLMQQFFQVDDRYIEVIADALSAYKDEVLDEMIKTLKQGPTGDRRRASYFLRYYTAPQLEARIIPLHDADRIVRYHLAEMEKGTFDPANVPPGEHVRQIVIFISIDTLRKDHLGIYGYYRESTPEMDAFFSEESMVFEQCFSHTSWTLPAHVSLLGSQDIYTHRVRTNDDVIGKQTVLLPEALKNCGFFTAGFTTHVLVSQFYNFHRGFDIFRYSQEQKAGTAVDRVLDFLSWYLSNAQEEEKGLFLFLHLFDPHAPYAPPEGFDLFQSRDPVRSVDRNLDAYDGEIRYTDHHLGRLFTFLSDSGLLHKTLTVVTSDHGEEFLDHRAQGHGHSLYNELILVPLLVRSPEFNMVRSHRTAQLKDIGPSLLRLLGCSIPASFEGQDDLLVRPCRRDDSLVFSEIFKNDSHKASVIKGDKKIIYDFVSGEKLFFDLKTDPREQHPLPDMDKDMADYLHFIREKSTLWNDREKTAFLPQEAVERLQALGYIDAADSTGE